MTITKQSIISARSYFMELIKDMLPNDTRNKSLYIDMFDSFSIDDYETLATRIELHGFSLPIFVKNMETSEDNGNFDRFVKAGEKRGLEFYERLILTDHVTGMEFMTPQKYLIITLSARRQIQHLLKKIALPENDAVKDQLTGQVTGKSKGASITAPEMNSLEAKGHIEGIIELAKVRGGDRVAASSMKDQIATTGGFSLSPIMDEKTQVKAVTTLKHILLGMHLDSTI